jgi:hypothetical protein
VAEAEEAALKHHAQLFVSAAQALLVRAVQDLADTVLPLVGAYLLQVAGGNPGAHTRVGRLQGGVTAAVVAV